MRSTQRLTATYIERLKTPTKTGKPEIVWDSDIKGFGVLLSGTSNVKAYIVRVSIKGVAKRPRLTLGRTSTTEFTAARQKAREYIRLGGDGIDPQAHERQKLLLGRTLRQVMDAYVADCRERRVVKEVSIQQLEDTVTYHLGEWLDLPMQKITRAMVEKRHAEIPGEIAAVKKGMNGRVQANHAMRGLRRLFNVARVDDEQLSGNPVDVLTLKKLWFPEIKRDDHVPPHAVEAFWEALDGLENQIHADLIKFMVLSGLREKNANAVRWSQVDLAQRAIRFEREQMKSKRVHELPMSDYLHLLLERRRALGDAGWVWPANSKSGHVEEIRKSVASCAKLAGIKKLTIHGLRRTFSTLARRVVAKDDVSRLVDHAHDSITDRYIISSVDALRSPMQKATDEILFLAGVNITDPDKLPKGYAATEGCYVRRFGAVTFDAKSVGKEKAIELMHEGLLRMQPVTDIELERRRKNKAA